MFHRFSFSSSSLKGRSVFVSLSKICIFITKYGTVFFVLSKWNEIETMICENLFGLQQVKNHLLSLNQIWMVIGDSIAHNICSLNGDKCCGFFCLLCFVSVWICFLCGCLILSNPKQINKFAAVFFKGPQLWKSKTFRRCKQEFFAKRQKSKARKAPYQCRISHSSTRESVSFITILPFTIKHMRSFQIFASNTHLLEICQTLFFKITAIFSRKSDFAP